MNKEKALLAGGCFWGMQDLFRKQPGVLTTTVGYSGDNDHPNATYENHGQHAEVIEIEFDPQITNYRNILAYFFQIHNPCTLNQQGNDVGLSYRSAIYYLNEQQQITAHQAIEDANATGLWPGPLVTAVEPAGAYWLAEARHQDYLMHNPGGYTCHFPRSEWVLPNA